MIYKYKLKCALCGKLQERSYNRKYIVCFLCQKKTKRDNNKYKMTPQLAKKLKAYLDFCKNFPNEVIQNKSMELLQEIYDDVIVIKE